jgi:hypothetical protein
MGKEAKTNAMRILERAKVAYTAHEYPHEEGVAVDGIHVAQSLGEDPACVYKTLVTQGASRNYFVFVIPVAAELDLKAAARSVGEKSVAMIHVADINKVCARRLQPGGHEEAVYHRVRRERPRAGEGLCLRRPHRYAGLLRTGRPHQGGTGHDGADYFLRNPLSRLWRQLPHRGSHWQTGQVCTLSPYGSHAAGPCSHWQQLPA